MRKFGFLILRVTFFLVLFVLATNVLFQRPWLELIMFSLALAVGLTPSCCRWWSPSRWGAVRCG